MAEAQSAGADAFFDEKYGDKVRTIRVEGFSHELCGGTHCRASGQVGTFVITGERSIGSGMRRIEAVTGRAADELMDERFAALERAAAAVGARTPEALDERIAALQGELRDTKRRLREGGAAARPKPGDLAGRAEEVAPGVRFIGAALDLESMDVLKGFAKDVRGAFPSGVIALGLDADEPQLFVTVSDDLVARGIAAGSLVQQAVTRDRGQGRRTPGDGPGQGRAPRGARGRDRCGTHRGGRPRRHGLTAMSGRSIPALAAIVAIAVLVRVVLALGIVLAAWPPLTLTVATVVEVIAIAGIAFALYPCYAAASPGLARIGGLAVVVAVIALVVSVVAAVAGAAPADRLTVLDVAPTAAIGVWLAVGGQIAERAELLPKRVAVAGQYGGLGQVLAAIALAIGPARELAIIGLVLSIFSVAFFVGLARLRGQESWISRWTPQST